MSSPIVSLVWDDHHKVITRIFCMLLEDHVAADCTIVAGALRLRAHKVVLSSFSSLFELLFQEENEKHPTIILTDTKFRDLRALIHYMYHGELMIPRNRVKDLFETAKYLDIRGLCDTIKDSTEKENDITLEKQVDSSSKRKRVVGCDDFSVMHVQNNMIMRRENQGDSIQRSDEAPYESSAQPRSSSEANCIQLHSDCVKVELPDDELFMTENTRSSEPEKSGNLYDGNKFTDVGTSEDTHLSLSTCVALKKESTGDDCDFPDELFNSELDLKPEDAPEEERATPDSASETFFKQGEGLAGEEHNANDTTQGSGVWTPVASLSDKSSLSVVQRPGCQEMKTEAHSQSLDASRKIPKKRRKVLHRSSKNESQKDLSCGSVFRNRMRVHTSHNRNVDKYASDCVTNIDFNLNKTGCNRKGKRPFKCDKCDYRAVTRSILRKHSRIHTGEKPFKCNVCDYSAGTKTHLKIHTRFHTGERPFKCTQCDYAAATKSHVKRHTLIHTGDRPFHCDKCPYSSGEKSNLMRHTRIHTGEKTLKCHECGYVAPYKCGLEQHICSHTGEKPYKCAECDYAAATKCSLKIHTRIHTGERRYKCNECDYSTRYKSDLVTHTRIHTGERPYKCNECDFSAIQRNNLVSHTRIHTGERPYKCNECDFSTIRKTNLITHSLIHTGERPFQCDQCSYSTVTKYLLRRHHQIHDR